MDFPERKSMEAGANSSRLVDPGPDPDPQAAEANDVERSGHDQHEYLQGRRFWLVTIGLAIQVFMVQVEVPIVTTSLVAITSELGGFDKLSWVISSYLLGYVAVIVIFAKFSDVFGRKPIYLLSMVLFIIFSAACSAAQTMTQLIIFRAFQGLGGGGCYSLSQVIITDLVPPERYSKYVSQLSIVSSLALLVGPVLGGAISNGTTWRWIFIINVPISAVAFAVTAVGMPRNFGLLGPTHSRSDIPEKDVVKSTLARIDLLGTVVLLLAVLSLTAGFEEAGSQSPWRSANVISLLTISGCLWGALLLWERYVTKAASVREPVLPWRFFLDRIMVGILLGLLFLGGPIIVSIFELPERFQIVYGLSGLNAGIRLIPFSLAVPVGTAMASGVASKFKVPAIYLILAGSCVQIIGFALLGTLPVSVDIPPQIYGFEFVAGFGCGMNFTPLFLLIPSVASAGDQAVGMGTGNQFRMMGGAIVNAITTSVFNSYITPHLASLGYSGTNVLTELERELASISNATAIEIRRILAHGYNRQMLVLCVSAAAQVPAGLLMWKKEQILV